MLKDKKAVIFDLDGTLVDSMGVWGQIDKAYLGSLNIEVPEGLQKCLEGMSFTETAIYFKNRFQIPASVEEIKEIWNRMAMEQYSTNVMLKKGAEQFLAELSQKGINMAIASSNSRQLIDAVLTNRGVRHYFKEIVICCEVKNSKPAPDVYLECAKRLNVSPNECLVFEDIVPGIMAGKNANMTVCAIQDDYSIFQEKEKRECADYFIDSYVDILNGTYEEL